MSNSIINPPNVAVVDSAGRLVPEWYRFFVAIQKRLDDGEVLVDESIIYAGGQEVGLQQDVRSTIADALMIAPPYPVPAFDDPLYPLASSFVIPDVLLPIQIEPDLTAYIPSGSALFLNTRAVTATASLNADDYLIKADATAAAITINLPAAAVSAKRVVVVKKMDASVNAVTIDPSGAETIDGVATLGLTTQYQSYTVHCDGTGWWVE